MSENTYENNNAIIHGEIASAAVYSHDIFGEGFYTFTVLVERLSKSYDTLPVLVSERLLPLESIEKGKKVTVYGQFRSYNDSEEKSKHRLILTVFAREIILGEQYDKNPNALVLDGYICKQPVFRKTPSGREIADILLAVNRSYSKSDYIPCIAWGRNARYCEQLKVGTALTVEGRIQSRTYKKRYDDGKVVDKVAYEVSVSKLSINSET